MNKSDPDRMESIVNEERGTDRAVADMRRADTGEVRAGASAGEASLRAVGSWFDDEDPTVTVSMSVGDGQVDVTMPPVRC